MGKNQHIIKNGRSWEIKAEGEENVTKSFKTQYEATEYARIIARDNNSDLIIHGKDGEVRQVFSYKKSASNDHIS